MMHAFMVGLCAGAILAAVYYAIELPMSSKAFPWEKVTPCTI